MADHQNKPDVALSIAREWFDRGVDALLEIGNSSIAIASTTLGVEKNKVLLNTAAGTSELTGKYCNPNLVTWSFDTWCLAHATTTSLLQGGADTWFFVTADYEYGRAAQADATRFVHAAGGKVVGSVTYPFPTTTDFSSYLLRAAASNAKVVAFANAGDDLINCMKQAQEFGLSKKAKLVPSLCFITDVLAMGLPVANGMVLTETFYWDLNDRTCRFADKVRPNMQANRWPNMINAGNYAATLHYLKVVNAMGVEKAKESGRDVVAAMKQTRTDDDAFGPGTIRPDGRKIHPAYLFEVKRPEESTHPGDVFRLLATTPADQAFRSMAEEGCDMVKT